MTFTDYLRERYQPRTVESYCYYAEVFTRLLGEEKAQQAGYSDIVNSLRQLRKRYSHAGTLGNALQAIKLYYTWLVACGQREEHPCPRLSLQDKRPALQLQDLFTRRELQFVLETERKAGNLRNQIVLSLLICQALTSPEIVRLTLGSLDLEKGLVHIPPASGHPGRSLTLEAFQILLLWRYLQEERVKLPVTTDIFLLNDQGIPYTHKMVSRLAARYKRCFPGRNLSPTAIRQSVIANLLKDGKDLRQVQLFAGHKYARTTEQYRETNQGELQGLIEKYHPLG